MDHSSFILRSPLSLVRSPFILWFISLILNSPFFIWSHFHSFSLPPYFSMTPFSDPFPSSFYGSTFPRSPFFPFSYGPTFTGFPFVLCNHLHNIFRRFHLFNLPLIFTWTLSSTFPFSYIRNTSVVIISFLFLVLLLPSHLPFSPLPLSLFFTLSLPFDFFIPILFTLLFPPLSKTLLFSMLLLLFLSSPSPLSSPPPLARRLPSLS